MSLRTFALSAVFVFAPFGTPIAAGSAPDAPAPAPDACTTPAQIPPSLSYGHAITDTRTLAFLAYLETIPEGERAGILKRASAGLTKDVTAEIDGKTSATCAATELAFRTTRFIYDVSKRWNGDDALALQPSAQYALAALYATSVSEASREAALAPFETGTKALDAFAEAALVPPSKDCSQPIRASAPSPINANFSTIALAQHLTGAVNVEVDIDEHGFITRASVYRTDLPATEAGTALAEESLAAAGSSSYTPEFDACHAVSGAYIFRSVFNLKP